MLVKYFDQKTVILSHDLLPNELIGLNKEQIMEKINTDYNLFIKLGHFSVMSEKYKKYNQEGMSSCKFKVTWNNSKNIKSLSLMEMCNLNYYIFTYPNSASISPFAFAVKYAIGLNYNYKYQQYMKSTGRYSPYKYVPY